MGIISDHILLDIVTVFIGLLTSIYIYLKHANKYWKRKHVPDVEPKSIFGNFTNPFEQKIHVGIAMKELYLQQKAKGHKHFGIYMFGSPVYVPVELDYIKNIMTKDFQHFVNRGVYYNEKDDPISAHLFSLGGTKWKNLRAKLTPTFTSGKMKLMFQSMVECGRVFEDKMAALAKLDEPLDIKELLACFTTDVIGSCAFGLEFNSFKDPNAPFRQQGRKILIRDTWSRIKVRFTQSFPNLCRSLGVTTTKKETREFFFGLVKKTLDYRLKNNYVRKDFFQLLLELYKPEDDADYKHDGKYLTFNEMVAQCLVFFVAGFETSSTTMTFALFELATNQELQDKLRREIVSVLNKYNGLICYESMQDMHYMNQVIDETLRKYPPVPLITRQCVKDYQMPGTDVTIEKGTLVFLSALGIHHDEDSYPNPEVFDPDRFSEENKLKRHHYSHLPFGEGPRICIGLRFGLLQSKIGLTILLKNYKFTLSKKTRIPLKMALEHPVLSAEGDIWLNIEKISS